MKLFFRRFFLWALCVCTLVGFCVSAAADEEKRFCKDCKHFLKHPFVDRCEIDNKPVDPMDDCEKFEKRPQK